MPSTAQHTLVKRVTPTLEVSLTTSAVADDPEKLDVEVVFCNVEHLADADTSSDTRPDGSWFRSLWAGEQAQLVLLSAELLLLMGYVQLFGYVRLNQHIGSDGVSDTAQSVYWKNKEYLAKYTPPGVDDKVEGIMHTPFFRSHSGASPLKGRIGGIQDLNARLFDPTRAYLLHDLAHGFNTLPLPAEGELDLSEMQQTQLASDLSSCIVPFYVTAQHLLFSSVRLVLGNTVSYKMRISLPPRSLPPSYNTKLSGAAGDAGLLSIAYLFVVGLLEEKEGDMRQRSIYFPLEFRPGTLGHEREWLQHDYLQLAIVDKTWAPEGENEPKEALVKAIDTTKTKIIDETTVTNDGTTETNDETTATNDGTTETNHETTETNDDITLDALTIENGNGHAHGGPKEAGDSETAVDYSEHQNGKPTKPTRYERFSKDLDTLIESSVHCVAINERRRSSVAVAKQNSGLFQQVPSKLRVSYQIRVNNRNLCVVTMSKPYYHVGEDIHFFMRSNGEDTEATRIVGTVTHIEAHEIFHVEEKRKVVNLYKVTPTVKINSYANALADAYAQDGPSTVASMINIPRFLCQQFQASSLMDLKYFLVFKFVLNDFDDMVDAQCIDEDAKSYTDYIQAYKVENEAVQFKFLVPLTVLP